jgi:small-conductance mechanosensitive channel
MGEKEIAEFILQSNFLAIILAVIIGMMLRDIVNTVSKGLLFKLSKYFNNGDDIVYNGNDGVIINIGWKFTTIDVEEDCGKIRYYVDNSEIPKLRLGKRKEKVSQLPE